MIELVPIVDEKRNTSVSSSIFCTLAYSSLRAPSATQLARHSVRSWGVVSTLTRSDRSSLVKYPSVKVPPVSMLMVAPKSPAPLLVS
jgi:hypothetical protein